MNEIEKIQRVRWLSSRLGELGLAGAVCGRFYQDYSLDNQISMLESLIDDRLSRHDGESADLGEVTDRPTVLEK
jgi:hypothetical protein